MLRKIHDRIFTSLLQGNIGVAIRRFFILLVLQLLPNLAYVLKKVFRFIPAADIVVPKLSIADKFVIIRKSRRTERSAGGARLCLNAQLQIFVKRKKYSGMVNGP